ncbi:hypothetical protein ACP70R_038953 [Stipagrostis hirtigluma subsp. patula]
MILGLHGVCYGVVGDNLPSRAEVVQLYKSSNIQALRIYYPDQEALAALRGSGIALILDAGGVDAVRELASNPSAAAAWVRANVQAFYPDVLIRYVAVGNEVAAGDAGVILPAMRNVQSALASAGLSGNVKVSTAVRMDVIADSFPPSSGVFSDAAVMAPVVRFLASTGAPLLANVYPYFAYRDNPRDISLGYATFRPGATVRDDGSGLTDLHEPLRRDGGRRVRRAGEGRRAGRQGRRVGERVAVGRRVRGGRGQREDVQPEPGGPRPARHAQEARSG